MIIFVVLHKRFCLWQNITDKNACFTLDFILL